MATLITYDGNERRTEEIEHPNDAGFSEVGGRLRHACGQFASSGNKRALVDGVYVSRTVVACRRCGVTVLS